MKTEIQETELYKKFKKALNITMDMRSDDNPFVVSCCEIAEEYANLKTAELQDRYDELLKENGQLQTKLNNTEWELLQLSR